VPDAPFQPFNRVMTAKVTVPWVEVDADGGRIDQLVDALQPVGMLAVLLMRFDADTDAT
jgi:hypothetical protein